MDAVWITSGSTRVEAMVNPLAAACIADGIEDPFIPDTVYFLDNPGLGETLSEAKALTREILEGHGVESPTIHTKELDIETDFEGIAAYFQAAVEEARSERADVAIDVTPGRKFMSVFAFEAGTTYDVDHLFYFYLHSDDHFDQIYQTIPRTAGKLYDFTEVI